MDSMDVARDTAVKMKGEDLAHAYDAVRVANKCVVCFVHTSEDEVFVFAVVICVFQVSGESAAWPAQPAGGAAEVSAAAAQSGRLQLFCWCTVTGISRKNTENMTARQDARLQSALCIPRLSHI